MAKLGHELPLDFMTAVKLLSLQKATKQDQTNNCNCFDFFFI
jgi:hypothetical protein